LMYDRSSSSNNNNNNSSRQRSSACSSNALTPLALLLCLLLARGSPSGEVAALQSQLTAGCLYYRCCVVCLAAQQRMQLSLGLTGLGCSDRMQLYSHQYAMSC
jgi:hypothetical protein